LAQPTGAVLTHDGQDKAGTTANAVLPEAGRGTANTANAKEPLAPSAAPTAPSAENASAAPAVIQSARVLERMGQSEMRLGLNSNNFGSIELHTRVNQDQVGASIATSHTGLRAAMIAEIPSLERAIAQHQLKLDSLNLEARAGEQNSGNGASAGNQSPGSSRQPAGEVSEFGDDMAATEVAPPQVWTAPHSSGLNVHA
jgi:flagellar hook-length control protein FliK